MFWLAPATYLLLQANLPNAVEHWLKRHPQAKRMSSDVCRCPELIATQQKVYASYAPFSNTGDFDHDKSLDMAVVVETPKGRQVLVFTEARAKSAKLAVRHGVKAVAGAVLVFSSTPIDDDVVLFVENRSEVPIVTDLQFGVIESDGCDTLVVKKDKWSLVPSCMTDQAKCIPAASR